MPVLQRAGVSFSISRSCFLFAAPTLVRFQRCVLFRSAAPNIPVASYRANGNYQEISLATTGLRRRRRTRWTVEEIFRHLSRAWYLAGWMREHDSEASNCIASEGGSGSKSIAHLASSCSESGTATEPAAPGLHRRSQPEPKHNGN